MRIVTWNVNGIRRIHKDLVRQGKAASFLDILHYLEGDIICIQELKSERATFDPVYVNLPGWRSYFSFPVDKKAYSGVAIYVKDRFLPLKVETAICGPAYDQFFALDDPTLIGGYPTQVSVVEARQIDREGRAVVLEFGGFILIGTYCPAGAESDDRVAYRQLWWRALDERCRNLVSAGREIVLTGDLNTHCHPIDMVDADVKEYTYEKLGPVGKTFLGLLHDDSREPQSTLKPSILVDLTRKFNPTREKMFTCWSVKLAARAGNYGTRIDFVLATQALLAYVTNSDTLPDIHGSDHCPVFADFDLALPQDPLRVSEPSAFEKGGYSNITTSQKTLSADYFRKQNVSILPTAIKAAQPVLTPLSKIPANSSNTSIGNKRKPTTPDNKTDAKKAQKTLASFFAKKDILSESTVTTSPVDIKSEDSRVTNTEADCPMAILPWPDLGSEHAQNIEKRIEASNAFASLFTKPEVPVCDGHHLPAKLQKTKKKGANQGREFYMCSMPLGAGQCDFWRWRKT